MVENLEKYKKIRSEREAVPDGIIRVNRTIQARNFIDHVLDEFNNKGKDSVTLSSLGQAITKAVTIAEIVKHRIAGLHQVNEINTIVIDDEYEPIEGEEELDKMTVSRKLTCLQITLTKTAPKDTKVPGYQPPIPESEVNPDAGPEDEGRRTDRRNRRRAKSATKKDGESAAPIKDADAGAAEEKKTEGGAAGADAAGKNRRNRNRQRAKTARPQTAGGQGGQNSAAAAAAATNPFIKDTPAGGNDGGQQRKPMKPDAQKGGNRRGGKGGGRGGASAAGAAAGGDAKPAQK